ncbi:MAG: hypothetical protein IJK34_00420, partial [Clostridia bacterium]|nr:hypothetical protein [Clostridia bacterium]
FNPYKEAFPEDKFKHYYRKLVFYPLFESTYQYGYIIVPLENHDYLFYELILEKAYRFQLPAVGSDKVFKGVLP